MGHRRKPVFGLGLHVQRHPFHTQSFTQLPAMSAESDARDKLEDLSGVVLQPGENPYAALIRACNDKPVSESESNACPDFYLSKY